MRRDIEREKNASKYIKQNQRDDERNREKRQI